MRAAMTNSPLEEIPAQAVIQKNMPECSEVGNKENMIKITST